MVARTPWPIFPAHGPRNRRRRSVGAMLEGVPDKETCPFPALAGLSAAAALAARSFAHAGAACAMMQAANRGASDSPPPDADPARTMQYRCSQFTRSFRSCNTRSSSIHL